MTTGRINQIAIALRTSLGERENLLALPTKSALPSEDGGAKGVCYHSKPTHHPPLGVFFAFTGFYFGVAHTQRATHTRPLPFATDFQTTLDEESARAGHVP